MPTQGLRYEDMLARLGRQGRAALLDAYALYQSGLIDRATYKDTASTLLQHINTQSGAYGRLSYETLAATMTGRDLDPARALESLPAPLTTQPRLARALDTILDGEQEQVVMRLERLGTTAPIAEVQSGYDSGLQADPLVEGWTRGMNDDACQLCRWWWREGRIWAKDHPLQYHKGCLCQKVPVWTRYIQETYDARQRRLREEAKERSELYRAMLATRENRRAKLIIRGEEIAI